MGTHNGTVYARETQYGWEWSCGCGARFGGYRDDERLCRDEGLQPQLTGASGRLIADARKRDA